MVFNTSSLRRSATALQHEIGRLTVLKNEMWAKLHEESPQQVGWVKSAEHDNTNGGLPARAVSDQLVLTSSSPPKPELVSLMKMKIISPKVHGLIDYALVAALLTAPSLCKFSSAARKIYAAEGLALLGYVAFSDHPAAVKALIPFPVHGKIDPLNVAQFAAQTWAAPFRKDRAARRFNIGFTAVAAVVVALTNWAGRTKDID